MSENMTIIRDNVFLVRTQAGFRKALKIFQRIYDARGDRVTGYPKTYPSLVVINSFYNGGNYVTCCQNFHLNELKEIIALDTVAREILSKQKEGNKHGFIC